MFANPRQAFWYILGGLFLLSAGLIALSRATIPYALPIMLILAGGIIIAAVILDFRPTAPAFAVFLVGIVVFGLAASGPFGFTAYTTTETYQLAQSQAPTVEEIDLSIAVSVGSIKVSFTSNQSQIYKTVFTNHYSIFYQPKVNFTYAINDKTLIVNATSTASSVEIMLNQNMMSRFYLTSSLGSIRVEVPTAATRVEKMILTTTTGEVWMNLTNIERMQQLTATTTTGQVEAYIKSSFQTRDATAQLETTTGRVKLNVNIANIESAINASTRNGNVKADDVIGFMITDKSETSFLAQTPDYATSPFRKLDIAATTTVGNIDITAHHS